MKNRNNLKERNKNQSRRVLTKEDVRLLNGSLHNYEHKAFWTKVNSVTILSDEENKYVPSKWKRDIVNLI